MDSRFSFLSTTHADLLNEILARRGPALLERVRQANSVSRSDAEEIMSVISDLSFAVTRRLRRRPVRSRGICWGRAELRQRL